MLYKGHDRPEYSNVRAWSANRLSGDAPVLVLNRNTKTVTDIMAKYWINTPNWKMVRKSGNLPMNPFYYYRVEERISGQTSARVVKKHHNGEIWYDTEDYSNGPDADYLYAPDVGLPSTRELESVEAAAVTKLLLSVKDQKVNLMQAYAERAQTGLLFGITAQRVVNSVNALKKGFWNGAAKALGVAPSATKQKKYTQKFAKDPEKAVASGWLELQYGWLPLLSDVYGSAELIAQKVLRQQFTRVSRGKTVSDKGVSVLEVSPVHKIQITASTSRTVKYTIYFKTTSESIHTLSQVGITNPALIAWELLPWSFVFDWFLPLGNYISSWDSTLGLEFEKGTKTVVDERTWSGTHVGGLSVSDNGLQSLLYTTSVKTEYKRVDVTRLPLSGWPSPQLPSFKNPVTVGHVANALALLSTTFRK